MFVNTTNENLCEFFPNDSPQEIIKEIHDVANSIKNIPSKGCIETTINKFFYRQFNPKKKDKNIQSKEEDKLVLFVCTDLKYKDIHINKFLDEVFSSLTPESYINYNLDQETKTNIAKIFYKYNDSNNIGKELNDLEKYNLEFGVLSGIRTSTSDNKNLNDSTTMYGIFDCPDDNSGKKENKSANEDTKIPIEIAKIKKWKTLKYIILFINIDMMILIFILFFYLIN